MENKNSDVIRQAIQDQYSKIAKSATQIENGFGNGFSETSCCGSIQTSSDEIARVLGYSTQENN